MFPMLLVVPTARRSGDGTGAPRDHRCASAVHTTGLEAGDEKATGTSGHHRASTEHGRGADSEAQNAMTERAQAGTKAQRKSGSEGAHRAIRGSGAASVSKCELGKGVAPRRPLPAVQSGGRFPVARALLEPEWSERRDRRRSRKNCLAKAPVRGRGSFSSALLSGLLLVLCAGVLFPAPARGQVLVSNLGQADGNSVSTDNPRAMRFTTGSSPGGYLVQSINSVYRDVQGDRHSATLCPTDDDGFPPVPPTEVTTHSSCVALTAPTDFSGTLVARTLTFTAPASTRLAPMTTYTLVFLKTSGDSIDYGVTKTGGAEDATSAPGWSIGDRYDFYHSSGEWRVSSFQYPLLVAVRGSAESGSPSSDATLSALELSGATLSPAFSSTVENYVATLGDAVSRITVTATPNHVASNVDLAGMAFGGPTFVYLDGNDRPITDADEATPGHQVDLSAGVGAIKVKVTGEDGTTTKTYTLTFTRPGIVHPRVLLDTTLTMGTYDYDSTSFTTADWWGFIPADISTVDTVHVSTGVAGSLGDADFVYAGVRYTVEQLAVSGTATTVNEVLLDLENSVGNDLPATANLGVELSNGERTFLVTWPRFQAGSDDARLRSLLTSWAGSAAGATFAVRVLDLDAPDVFGPADLGFGTEAETGDDFHVGYPEGGGTLSPSTFDVDGIDYTVDSVSFTSAHTNDVEGPSAYQWRLGTTPDLPSDAGYRLAVPTPRNTPGIVEYYPLPSATDRSDVLWDYAWNTYQTVMGLSEAADRHASSAREVYLTRAPGDTGSATPFWAATLTPETMGGGELAGIGFKSTTTEGYESLTASLTGGSLSGTTARFEGVSYTVEMIAYESTVTDYRHMVLVTTPVLPADKGIGLELEYETGGPRVLWLHGADNATDTDQYVWENVDAVDHHGWHLDSDNDGTPNARTVRFVVPGEVLPPSSLAVAAAGTSITLTYDEALDAASVPDRGDFTVRADGASVSVASVTVRGSTVILTLGRPVHAGDAVEVDYAPGANPLLGAGGTRVAALARAAAENASTAVPADAIAHPRVLLDTTLTMGTYQEAETFATAGQWGFIDDARFAPGVAGSLGDVDFVYGGVRYTVKQFAVRGTASSVSEVLIDFEDSGGNDLPSDASVGVELSNGERTFLVTWPRFQAGSDDARLHELLTSWAGSSAGTTYAVRVLDLDGPDLYGPSAFDGGNASDTAVFVRVYGSIGDIGGLGTNGTLSPEVFELDGVDYAVDVVITETTGAVGNLLLFSTAPELSSEAGYRLAIPTANKGGSFGGAEESLVDYYPLTAGARGAGQPLASQIHYRGDYYWRFPHWGDQAFDADVLDPRTLYLTRSPGDTDSATPFWEATLTPGVMSGDAGLGFKSTTTEGYGSLLAAATGGSLSGATAYFEGVYYSVEMIAFESNSGDGYENMVLVTTPVLPADKGIGLELAYETGGPRVLWLHGADNTTDTDQYVWEDVDNQAYHGWPRDSDGDGTPDVRTVRLVVPGGFVALAPPSLAVAAAGTSITLTYDEALDAASVPDRGDFTVRAGGAVVSVASVTVRGSTVILTLGRPVYSGEAVEVDYTPGANPIRSGPGTGTEGLAGAAAENASTAVPADAIAHPRVLLDTTLTMGTYQEADAFVTAGQWGFIDDAAFTAGAAGSLGDVDFVYGGVRYTVKQFAVRGTASSVSEVLIDFEDSGGNDLPDTANVGVELSNGDRTFLVTWPRFQAGSDDGRLRGLLRSWAGSAAGTTFAVRVLDLAAADLFGPAVMTIDAVFNSSRAGYRRGSSGSATLSPTAFELDGVSYSITQLSYGSSFREPEWAVYLGVDPDLPMDAGYRLAIVTTDRGGGPGIFGYHPVAARDHRGTGNQFDYRWGTGVLPAAGSIATPQFAIGTTAEPYITRSPGETDSAEPFWEATLTPAAMGSDEAGLGFKSTTTEGYRTLLAAATGGSLSGATAYFEGVAHTVGMVAFESSLRGYREMVLATAPALPSGKGIGLELEYELGGPRTLWLDDADNTTDTDQYAWASVDGVDYHRWNLDSDSDGTLDVRAVRLVAPGGGGLPAGIASIAVAADGLSIVITYDAALNEDSEPAASDFVVRVAGVAVTVSSVAVSGSTVTLTLAAAIYAPHAVEVDYTKPTAMPLQDAAMNDLSGFLRVEADNDSALLSSVTLAAPALLDDYPGSHLFEFEATQEYPVRALHTDAANLTTDAAWKLTRVGDTGRALTVTLTVSESGSDFVTAADEGTHTVTFAANETEAYFKVVTDDGEDEAHGTVTVTLEASDDYAISGTGASTVAVRDDDGPQFRYSLEPLDLAVAEGDSATFTVLLTSINDGLEAGTFTHAEDLGRAMRNRGASFFYGSPSAWGVDLHTVTVGETTHVFGNADFIRRNRGTGVNLGDHGWTGFTAAAGGVFERRTTFTGNAVISTFDNDDGVVGTEDTNEIIAPERFVAKLCSNENCAAEEGLSGRRGHRLVPAQQRENIADLTDGDGNVVELDGPDFIAGVVTIYESLALSLQIDDDMLAEGDADAGEEQTAIWATLGSGADAAFDVTVSATSTDTGRWEFVGSNRTLSFAENATRSTGAVVLRAIHNDLEEGDHTVTVTGTPPTGSGHAVVEGTVTILDDDRQKVSIAPPEQAGATTVSSGTVTASGFVYEGDTASDNGKWKLTRTGLTDAALTVTVRASESGGGDFVSFAADADQTVDFAADETVVYYTPVTVDTTDETHGTVTVTLQPGTAYEIDDAATAAVAAVRDDDAASGAPLLTVGIDPTALTVREGSPANLVVVATTIADGTFTAVADLQRLFGSLVVTVNAQSADGTAVAGTDYTALDAMVQVNRFAFRAAGPNRFTARVSAAVMTTPDTVEDPGETFTVTLSLPSNADARMALDTAATTATVTLAEAPVVTLALDDDDLTEGETATVTATVDPAHDAAFTVMVATDPASSPRFGFVGDNRTLTFAANATTSTGTVQVRAVDNAVDEADVEKNAADGFSVTGTVSDADVAAPVAVPFAVRDNDLPVISIRLNSEAGYVAGGHIFEAEAAHNGTKPWRLEREGLTDAALDVTVSVSETGGGDFVTDGQATVTFAVGLDFTSYTPVTADTVDEPHGTVTLALVDGAAYDVDRRSLTISVRDDDGTLLTLGAEPETLSVREGQPARVGVAARTVADGTFTESGDFGRVFGTDVSDRSVTVNASTGGGTATAGGTDYTALPADTSATVTFANMARFGSGGSAGFALASPVALPPIATEDDTVDDAGETFEVTLTLASGTDGRVSLSPAKATATLVEGPAVTLVLDDDDLTEGETATVTATVDPVHTAAFTVTVATDPASSPRFEFVGTNKTLSFAANAGSSTGTVQIRAVDNDVDEADVEKNAADGFSVTGTVSDADVAAPAAVPFAVRDNDLPVISIALNTAATGYVAGGRIFEAEAAHNGTKPWLLTREGLTDATLDVTVSVSETGGGDFVTDGQATVTFAVGLDIASYTPVTADAVDESHGRVRVALVDGTAYDVDAARRALAVDVRDDDGTLLTLGAEPETLSVREGEPAQVGVAARTVADGTFTESGDFGRVFGTDVSDRSVTVNASTGGGTATAGGTDYTALPADTSVAVTFADMAAVGSGATAGFALASPVALPPIATAEDAVDDADETFEVTLTLASGTDGRVSLSPAKATATLLEEAPVVTLVLDDDDLTEGETATVTATVDPVHTAAFTVTVALDPASSRRRVAIVEQKRTLSFAANAASSTGTVRIHAVDNVFDEADVEKNAADGFSVTGTVSDADVTAPAAVPYAVRDNDLPKVSIARPELAGGATGFVYEGETAMDSGRWKLTREGLTDAALTVTVRASETGSATTDFVGFGPDADQTVTFAANETVAYYTPVTVDAVDETHGTVTVTLQSGTAYAIEGAASAVTNVRDDDGTLLTLGAEPETLSVREGQPAQVGVAARTVADGTFTAAGDFGRVFGSTVTSVTVNASTGGGDATAGGTDYTALPPNTSVTVTFANMARFGSGGSAGFALASPVALPPIATEDDTVDDAGETFEVTLTLATGTDSRMALDPDTSTVTLAEAPVVTLVLDDDDLTEGETATVTATVDPVHDAAFTVTVATDPADSSSDRFEFVGANRTLSFAASAASSTGEVQVRAVDNDVDEADVEKNAADGFSVTGTVSAGVDVTAPAAVPFAVRDNDLPVISIALNTAATGYVAGGHIFEAEATNTNKPWLLTREGLTDAALDVTVSVSVTNTIQLHSYRIQKYT